MQRLVEVTFLRRDMLKKHFYDGADEPEPCACSGRSGAVDEIDGAHQPMHARAPPVGCSCVGKHRVVFAGNATVTCGLGGACWERRRFGSTVLADSAAGGLERRSM